MRILDRYIARQVIGGTLVSLALLVALLGFVTLVDDLDSVGRGDYTLARAFEYMILTLPRQIFSGVSENLSPTVTAAAVVLIVVCMSLMIAVEVLRRRSARLQGKTQ